MQRNINPILYTLIALGTLAGIYGSVRRYQAEALNRAVEIAVDYDEVRGLAQMTGATVPEALYQLKSAGVTSVAVTEDTIGALDSAARIRPNPQTGSTVVDVADDATLMRIRGELAFRGIISRPVPNGPAARGTVFSSPTSGRFYIDGEYKTLREIGIGLDPDALRDVSDAGLRPVARIGNFDGVSAPKISSITQRLQQQGIKIVVFQGTEVLGYRGLHKETASALDASGINFGWIEFGKQKGEERLGTALDSRYVRVHSISEAELGTLSEDEILDRFVKAGRERNARLLYVRLPNRAGDDPLATNAEFIGKVSRSLQRGDLLRPGVAHSFTETGVPTWAFVLMALGTAGGLTLLFTRFASFSDTAVTALLVVSVIGCAGLVMGMGEGGRKLVALLAAVVFPTLACLRRDLLQPPGLAADSAPALPKRQAATRAVAGLAAASAVTAIGIAHVVGLLATRPFLVKTQQFMGIKAAHAIPILIIGVIAIVGLPRLGIPWREEGARLKERLSSLMAEPTRVGQLLLTLTGMVVFLIIVARTGNEPGVGVSGIELKFRALLDRLLGVRPRTKEFLIGHPALVFALALWFRGRRRIALPFFVVGVLGQVSILNTFCHIHTPLVISAVRDLTGLVLGAALGLAAFFAFEAFFRPGAKAPDSVESRPAEPLAAAAR